MFRVFIIFAVVCLYSCSGIPNSLPEADDLSSSENHVIVVGKFELDPPFNPELEQKTHWNVICDEQMINKVAMATGDTSEPVSFDKFRGKEWRNYIRAEWGKPFAVQVPRKRTYLKGAVVQLDVLSQDKLWFPGGFYFDVPENVSAIYIGTLRYTRNEFNTIESAEVVDEYNQTLTELSESFENISLVKRHLLKKTK
tara:strand:- start:68696 stop:69286 length:591 start_codon:yes stop_codon:yes gene_type:complete